jgi:hypothetical protein
MALRPGTHLYHRGEGLCQRLLGCPACKGYGACPSLIRQKLALLVPLKCRIHMTRAFACWGVIVSAKGHSAHVEAHGLSGPRSLFLTVTCPVESFAFIRAHLTDPVSRMRRSRAHHLKAGSGASALLHLRGFVIGRVVLSSCFTLVHDKQTKLLSD